MLLGRSVEQRRLVDLLANARSGRSDTLVLVGEPGIGKSSLLEYTAAQADEFEIVYVRGVESEAELPFAGLFDVCRPFLEAAKAVGFRLRRPVGAPGFRSLRAA